MRATSADLTSTPVAARQVWARLGILAAVLAGALGSVMLVVAWLLPPNPPSRVVKYQLADLEVGVPAFYRPFEMGRKAGRLDGIWLVRQEDDEVQAFWSRPAHPGACPVSAGPVTLPLSSRSGAARLPTATPVAPFGSPGSLEALGFREPCMSSQFLLDGSWVYGPPPRGLDRFAVTIEGGTVSIDVGRLFLGACGATVWNGCSTPERPRMIRTRWPSPERNVR